MSPRSFSLAALLLVSTLGVRAARAEPPPLSDAEVTRRLDFIQVRLELRKPAADRFWYGWYTTYLTIATVQATLALATTSRDFRVDRAVGAVTASLGVIPLGFLPPAGVGAAAELRDLPGSTPAERRKKLARGERLLEDSASGAKFSRSWLAHVAGGLVSVGSGLLLIFAYDRKVSGALAMVSGIAVTELQIFTRPTAPIDDWREYQALGAGAATRPPRFGVTIEPGGLGFSGRF